MWQDFKRIMIWHILAMNPCPTHILCEHWHEKSLQSSSSNAACLTPHIFETWLHSLSMNSCSTCPLHPTHLNHKATYRGNDTQGPLLAQRPNEHAPGGSTGVWWKSAAFWRCFRVGDLWVTPVMVVHADGLQLDQITSHGDQIYSVTLIWDIQS